MIHQWKRRGINAPTITKLLDLYLGMPAYMDSKGIYPLRNFYDIRLSLRFSYTSALLAAVTNCRSFGMIWDEAHANVLAFYSPLWYHKEEGNPTESPQDSAQKTPQDPAQDSAFNNNIIYNINNIYPPEDSRKGYSPETECETQRKRMPERLLRRFLRKHLTAGISPHHRLLPPAQRQSRRQEAGAAAASTA